MYGFQQKIIHDKKKKREELRYHRIVGTKQRIKRKCEKKNKKNKTQIKSAFDAPYEMRRLYKEGKIGEFEDRRK